MKGNDGYLLIDAGFDSPEAFEALEKQLGRAGAGIGNIDRLIITHAHGDHIGLAGRIRALSGAKIAMHRLEQPGRLLPPRDRLAFLKQTEEWTHAAGMPHGELTGGGEPVERGPSLPSSPSSPPLARKGWGIRRLGLPARLDVTLDDGEHIAWGAFDLRVIWTPGHSPGHICLHEADNRLLFSGDHVLPVTTPNIGLRPGQTGRSNPLGDFFESLDKVRGLDARLVLPAHEHPFADLPRRVDEMKEHHRRRSQEILDTLAEGPKTAYEVSGAVTWMPESGGIRFRDLRHWHQRMAVSETLAHLEALRAGRHIRRFLKDSVVYYSLDH
jgi:glyoxylase-like metal-dependent hydrolase (beta-lactamase superfamily II)